MGSLAGYLLSDGCHVFRSLGRPLEVVEKACAVRLREENGTLVFLDVRCHCERVVGEFVVPRLIRSDAERLWSGPVLSIDDWLQQPMRVGLIVDGQVTRLFGTYGGREMKNLRNVHDKYT